MIKLSHLSFVIVLLCTHFAYAQTGPKVLVVTAHPDDESGMAATIYKITHELKGTVDQCVITNGEAGYKYSTLAESYYGAELTDEKIGREKLPKIRKKEMLHAGRIIGSNDITFLNQKDAHYGLDEHEPLDTTWDVKWVKEHLNKMLVKGKYDFVFCLIPDPATHGGHKAATLMALRAVQELPAGLKPIILACTVTSKTDTVKQTFHQLKDYKETLMEVDSALFHVDRTASFGYNGKLNYKIIVNWEIAEHKSQGTMQTFMNMGDYENFWYFAINGKAGIAKCKDLFERLKNVPYKAKTY